MSDASRASRVQLLRDLVLGAAVLAAEGLQEPAALASSVERLISSIGDPTTDEELHRLGSLLLDRPRTAVSRLEDASEHPVDELTADRIEDYLRRRFPAARDEERSVTTIHGGYSKRTTLVDGSVDGVNQQFVLRQTPADLSARSLIPEYTLLEG